MSDWLRGLARRLRLDLVLYPLLAAAIFIAIWYGVALVVHNSVLVEPYQSVRTLISSLRDPQFRSDVGTSVATLAIAWGACVFLGSVVGFVLGLSHFWRSSLLPLAYAAYSIPQIALYPIFLLFFGIGAETRVIFAFSAGIFPMVILVANGTANVPREYLKLAGSLRLSPWRLVRHVILPAALPSVATGARLTVGLVFLGLIVVEMFSGASGIGYELIRNVSLLRIGDMVGDVILVAVIALVPTSILRWLEAKVSHRYGVKGSTMRGE